jgi:pyrroline-5-carboxylate reductase
MAIDGVLGIIGAGNMGAALARGVIGFQVLPPDHILVIDINSEKTAVLAEDLGVCVAPSSAELLAGSDVVVLAVKPQFMAAMLEEIAPHVRPENLIISIAAGIPAAMIEKALGGEPRVVRVMPNTPLMCGYGAAGAARGRFAGDADMQAALDIFRAVGVAVEVDESQINAVTGLSGSGPAYVFRLMEALKAAGEQAGLSPEVADVLSRQTVLGAAMMVDQTKQEPAELRRQVTSPNGTTEAGLKVLDDGGFMDLIARTVLRATERGDELAKLAELHKPSGKEEMR